MYRPYDLDVQFHHYECVYRGEPLNCIVKELMGSISFPSRDRVKFRSKTSGWSIGHIQHKQNRTYLSDGKWAITIADVSEHAIDDGSSEWTELEMKHVTRTEVAVSKNSGSVYICIFCVCIYIKMTLFLPSCTI